MTELNWDLKIERKKKISKIILPFQNIETVNESTNQRQKILDLFSQGQDEWRNRLIWGDKKYVLPSLAPEFAGKVKLIYIDPPFDTQANFSYKTTISDNPLTPEDETTQFVKSPSIIEQKAYRDIWSVSTSEKNLGATHLDKYLSWFYETMVYLKELLSEDGSIFVHLDYHVSHYAKIILDEVFGINNFRNEIIWKRKGGSGNPSNNFGVVNDYILYYSKSSAGTFYPQHTLESEEVKKYIKERFKEEINGRKFMLAPIERNVALGVRKNLIYEFKGYTPKYGWMVSSEKLKNMNQEKKIHWNTKGRPNRRVFLDEYKGQPIENLWSDIFVINPMAKERVGYDTQKPEELIKRIIHTCTEENDLVLDCFVGSGTTAAAAEKTNRKWIVCDLGKFAIHTTRKRLLSIKNIRPFNIQNLGKYERQQWVKAEFDNFENRTLQEKAYKKFIIELYKADNLDNYLWIHGSKDGRLIHIGAIDAPVTVGDIKSIAQEFWKLVGIQKKIKTNGIDILGWDFSFDVNERAKQFAEENKIDVKFKKIPLEVLDKEAVDQGDITFFELASLDIDIKIDKKKCKIKIKNFTVPPDDIPEEALKSITHWQQYIDYLAIDWNYKDDTFHNQWQSYRSKENKQLKLEAEEIYTEKGDYTILVKVIDILGNDTTKICKIKIK